MATPGEIVEYNGREARVCRNGALQDVESGKIVSPPDAATLDTIRTSEHGRALAFARWHAPRQRAAVEAVRQATGDGTIDSIDAADAYMVRALVEEVVLNIDVPGRDRIAAHRHILEQSGMDGRPDGGAQPQPPGGVSDVAISALRDIVVSIMSRRNA
jgi:hypothetical protein